MAGLFSRLLFAVLFFLMMRFSFGLYWAGIYEHLTWHRSMPNGSPLQEGAK